MSLSTRQAASSGRRFPALTIRVPRQRSSGESPRVDDLPISDGPARGVTPRWQRRYRRLLVTSDLALSSVGALSGLFVRFTAPGHRLPYVILTLTLPVVFVLVTAAGHGYDRRFFGCGPEELRRPVEAVLRVAAAAAVVSFTFRLNLSRGYLLVAFAAMGALTLVGRLGARRALQRARTHGRCQERVIVVGRERSVAELVRQARRQPTAGFQVIGCCLDGTVGAVEGVPVLGEPHQALAALRATGADAVAVTAWSDLSQADLRRLCWQLEGSDVQVLLAPRLTDIAGPRIHVRPVAGLPLLHVEQPAFSGGRRLVKGAAERAAAALALLALSPVLFVIALLVRLTSRGPAFYRQTRIGVAGRPFSMWKFRSMVPDADERRADLQDAGVHEEGLLFKLHRDPRVTPLGRWLRRLSLDELPQLINVVTGSMSLVGPRPPLPEEVAGYASDVRRRLLVRPGITGLWQISGRSDLPWRESVRLDLYYVENWSLGLDASILFRTLLAVLSGKGAY